jgi:hypothetical protein
MITGMWHEQKIGIAFTVSGFDMTASPDAVFIRYELGIQ